MSVLGRPTWAIFDVHLHQRVTALVGCDDFFCGYDQYGLLNSVKMAVSDVFPRKD